MAAVGSAKTKPVTNLPLSRLRALASTFWVEVSQVRYTPDWLVGKYPPGVTNAGTGIYMEYHFGFARG